MSRRAGDGPHITTQRAAKKRLILKDGRIALQWNMEPKRYKKLAEIARNLRVSPHGLIAEIVDVWLLERGTATARTVMDESHYSARSEEEEIRYE